MHGRNRVESLNTAPPKQAPGSAVLQKTLNGEIHDWYRIVLGFPDHLVDGLIQEFDLGPRDTVLDPFCGTGTTLVECMKRGINAVGVDANPSSCFASKVKTSWDLDPDHLMEVAHKVWLRYKTFCRRTEAYKRDPTYKYLTDSGMIERGWISEQPLRKALAIKESINQTRTTLSYKGPLWLALLAEIVKGSSNVKFGPELYCGKKKEDAPVWRGFSRRVKAMADDLRTVRAVRYGQAQVVYGDSREEVTFSHWGSAKGPSAVICSPPYPTEHDYTRNSRLELAFLEAVTDRESLRVIKKLMIRSHTKGIYAYDEDRKLIRRDRNIMNLVAEIEERASEKKHGFARLYGTVIEEYFGGMRRHFRVLSTRIKKGTLCAYVVGDQSSYVQVHIPTADILGRLAEREGFKILENRKWRGRLVSTTLNEIDENILIMLRTG